MPHRLNVYIPDDLALALESRPDDLNVSAVCQDAIRRALGLMSMEQRFEILDKRVGVIEEYLEAGKLVGRS